MKVSELTDTELNRAMIWLYPPKQSLVDDNGIHTRFLGVKGVGYIQDWNLLMPITIKVGVSHQVTRTRTLRRFTIYPPLSTASIVDVHKPLERAYCEALVSHALENK